MKKVITIILDGFGLREESHGNAIKSANMECFNKIWNEYPHSILKASEEAVGLSNGQFGNSETGHETIGAGRIVKQHELLVDEFFLNSPEQNTKIKEITIQKDKKVHLMGLLSDGNVHAGIDDFINMYNLLVGLGMKKIYFHIITDGRDTSPKSSYSYIRKIEEIIKDKNVGKISTVCGRYYAMDRDKNYDRTKKYYDLITSGIGINKEINIESIINNFYEQGITDEFILPTLIDKDGLICNNDIIIWMNYREDRSKQIIESFLDEKFLEFPIKKYSSLDVYTFFKIDEKLNTNIILKDDIIDEPLGIYLSKLGLTQARIAESEKFPHVTYFFDGGYNRKIDKCTVFHIPSPKVKTYVEVPQMSAVNVTKKAMECMEKDYDFILLNFANPDMVGHTGNFNATVNACVTIDLCLKKIIEIADDNFYKVIILSDHGNADIMLDENNNPVTTHTLSPVPFIILDKNIILNEKGSLINVAPTILDYMDISVPEDMKDTPSLIKKQVS